MRFPDGKPVKYRATKTNSGLVVKARGHDQRPLLLKHKNGRPLQAGDLKAGQVFTVDFYTGVVELEKSYATS